MKWINHIVKLIQNNQLLLPYSKLHNFHIFYFRNPIIHEGSRTRIKDIIKDIPAYTLRE